MKKILIALAVIAVLIFAWFLFSRYQVSNPDGTGEAGNTATTSVDILFTGDIMLDRGVRNAIAREGLTNLLSGVSQAFADLDMAVGNLEGTVTEKESIAVSNNEILRFTFDPAVLPELKAFGFKGFNLANNHTLDFGQEGYLDTRRFLEANGLFSFGSALNGRDLTYKLELEGEKICFAGYHSLFRPGYGAVLEEIKNFKNDCTFIVISAHWGDEYADGESVSQREAGRAFVDAGADLVTGHHPHVVQPVEIYKNKPIFYSLGNFIFDQDFSTPTRQGLMVRLAIEKDRATYHLIPIEMSRAKLYFPEKEVFQPRMDILISKLPEPLKTQADIDSIFSLSR